MDGIRNLVGTYRHALLRVFLSVFIVGTSGVGAYLLRFDFQVPALWYPGAVAAMACWLTIQPLALHLSGWSRVGWNRVALPDAGLLLRSAGIAAAVSTAAILLLRQGLVPRSVFVLQAALVLTLSISARIVVRLALERRERGSAPLPLRRAIIYGAGSAGQALLRELNRKPRIGYRAVGFVDDDDTLHGQIVQGVRVLGNGLALNRLVANHAVDEILIALPSVRGTELQKIVTFCDQAGRPCKTIPGVEELIRKPERLTDLRQVNLEDLLGRDPVQLDLGAISRRVAGRVVLVTGAAGSIGSEICRQVAAFRPLRLVAVDIAETPLFELENEFRGRFADCPMLPTIGDVRDEAQMLRLMRTHDVEIVFHAAAYKHVPMMERHISEALANNVFGTLALVNAAERAAIGSFVMISTDKAVRPSSVMGATKRLAELIVKSRSGGATRFVSVRFGNVLGSNGSVVPIFERQIRDGGPVTVTHPEMRRYFMTIPEAAQLVLQAMALGTSDEIFVLDMGSPVRIGDLARSLIALHGKVPGRDIALEYTGLRPGEKLFEELYLSDENLVRTVHQKILVLKGEGVARAWLDAKLAPLRQHGSMDKAELRAALRSIVPDYAPASSATPQAGDTPSAPDSEAESLVVLRSVLRNPATKAGAPATSPEAWEVA
ncbi:MAG: nucleoside-diphosphate sugar epimerase/dehydratase [Bryobacterales bacterium]|nr:nucleoside-diphosphate sugar epimerase/dehydratase [Bryobacterales bacterium]